MPIDIVDTGENNGSPTYVPKTDEEIKAIALDYYKQKIFCSWDVPEYDADSLGMVFMPLFFMDAVARKRMVTDGTMYLYEYYDQAGPRSINGMPIFTSFYILNKADVERIIAKRNSIAALLDAV